ncbi:MAG: hypothetical protein DCF22_18935 [Leptolyngbya sp.]|nr:MAG: hypothetical protein DCF22_18935 [Leptolyngbya sp.]
MPKEIVIWSVIGAIAISAIAPEPAEARRRSFSTYRRQSTSVFRPVRRSHIASRQTYYRPTSYTVAQIDRTGAAPKRAAPVKKQSIQGDDRFPLRPEPNLAREPQSGVDQAKVNSLRNYARNQPYQAMRKLLGQPSRRTESGGIGAEIYNIKGTGSPYEASKRLVIHYQRSPVCNCTVATGWHQE